MTWTVLASAVRLRIRIPLRFADDYSTTATVFWSIAIEAQLYILLPLCESLRSRKVTDTRSAR